LQEYEKKYTVQIAAFYKPVNTIYFKNIKDIQVYYTGKYYLYTTGEFEDEALAKNELEAMKELGYKDAYIKKILYYFPKRLRK